MLEISRQIRAKAALIILVLSLSLFASSIQSGDFNFNFYEVEIIKSKRILLLKLGSKIKKQYSVALGSGGQGDKHRLGDRKTPIGTYRIIRFNQNSPFYYFMQLSYPNIKDALYGFRNHLLSIGEFNRIIDALNYHQIPPQDTLLGGSIGIHGLGEVTAEKLDIHRHYNWTQGCIAMTNENIDELRRYVGIGTRVVINE